LKSHIKSVSTRSGGRRWSLAATLVLALGATTAQAQPQELMPPTGAAELSTKSGIGFTAGSVVVAPIPFQNPALGTGLALGGAYLFKSDAGSDSSNIGLGGFRTDNSSQGYGFATNLNFRNNRWKFAFVAADADLFYELYVLGVPVPIQQSAQGARAEFNYGLTPDLSFGFGLAYAKTKVTLDDGSGGLLPTPVRRDSDLGILKFSLLGEWDRRDDTIYPTSGTLVKADLSFNQVTNIRDREYGKGTLKLSGYLPVFGNGVLASQAVFCAAGASAPFFDSCAIGPTDSFRGYAPTEFLNNGLFSVQAEYRGRFNHRFGYVVFAGTGAVGNDLGEAIGGAYHAAAGVGLRIRLSKKFPVDYAIDVSRNEQGQDYLYISVGQRF